MNILIVNYEYPPIGAGAANASRYLAQHLALLGHKVSVLTAAFGANRGKSIEEKVTVYRVPASRKKLDRSNIFEMASFVVSAIMSVGSIIRRENIDRFIVFFSIPGGPVGLYAKLRYKVPYVVSLRGGDVPGNDPELSVIHRILTPLRRLVLKNALTVIANSNGLKNLSEKADHIPVQVIPNGVDTDFFAPDPDGRLPTAGVFKFLFVGRLQEQKNLFFLLDAFSDAKKSVTTQLEMHLVGNGPLETKLKEYTDTLGIKDSVAWHGWLTQEQLREQYHNCNCLVNPSLCEGMPNAVLEAMACGLPVIASDVVGNRDVVGHEKTGLLFVLGDKRSLKSCICALVDDLTMSQRLGQSGRKEAVEKYSWYTAAELFAVALNLIP